LASFSLTPPLLSAFPPTPILSQLQKSTRATRMAEVQSELFAVQQELDRLRRMNAVMEQRLGMAEDAAHQVRTCELCMCVCVCVCVCVFVRGPSSFPSSLPPLFSLPNPSPLLPLNPPQAVSQAEEANRALDEYVR
jgi:hypothetical protein